MNPLNFTALDFETATPEHNSICQVGIVQVKNGIIFRKYSSLVKPPNNEYYYHNIKIHGIEPFMTSDAPDFKEIWNEIWFYFANQHIVCHNSSFDLMKLEQTLNYYDIEIPDFTHSCTLAIYQKNLTDCCTDFDIKFNNHHDALSDAEACAILYILAIKEKNSIPDKMRSSVPFEIKRIEKVDLIPDFNVQNQNNPFFQKKVVFTGDLVQFTRTEAAHKIKLLGADVNTCISRKTDFVIIGRNPGPSKIEKIQEFGIRIISEHDFLRMLEE